MSPERRRQIEDLFRAALARKPTDRSSFLAEVCGRDEPLQSAVETLLNKAGAGTLLEDRTETLGGSPPGALAGPGAQLGPYRIEAPLGAGGMGQVFRARDTRLGRAVALKLVRTESAASRFFREARAASALNHPNIITIYDIGESGPSRYIAMELVQGRTLRSLSGAMGIDELRQIGAQAARALSAAHAAGIVHRDIKPENIMIRDDGYVKVLDFGLARVDPAAFAEGDAVAAELSFDDLTAPGTLLGTLRYMSPEQARAEAVTTASDVFSLGIVLYQLAAGRHPFVADNAKEMLSAIQTAPAPPLASLGPSVPPWFDALVLRMLEKDPRLRPTAAEVEASLTESGAGVAARSSAHRRRTVGRTKELGDLQAAYEAVVSGQGLMAGIAGEPGIGKTTLADQFLEDLTSSGTVCSIARGRCSERLAGTEAYLPILESLESLLRGPGGEGASRLLQTVAPAWFLQVASAGSRESTLGPALADAQLASQERLKREMAAFFQEMCRVRPLILFLEDLHWADISTIDLLAYIGSRLDSMRLLLLATYRPADLQASRHAFLPVKLEMQGRNLCREIAVQFLRDEDVEQYLDLEYPGHQFPPELPAVIHARTEGNALFMVDLVRYLRERGVLVHGGGQWILGRALAEVERELPESVRSVIQKKVDQFTEDDRRLLTAASVQGYEFDSGIVAKVLSLESSAVEDRLEALDRTHGFVRLAGEREFPDSTLTLRYAFVHVLYQNSLYGSLTATRRASLSASVAAALTGAYGVQSAEIASELALLYETARDFARSADFFLQAAKNANRIYATEEADALALRAIASAERLKDRSRYSRVAEAAMLRSQIHHPKGMVAELLADFDLAEESARLAGDAHLEISVILARANTLLFIKRIEEADREARRGLDLAQHLDWEFGIAAAEGSLANVALVLGNLDEAEGYYERAVPVVEQGGPAPVVMGICATRAWLHEYQLEYAKAERMLSVVKKREQEEGAVNFRFMYSYINGLSLANQGRVGEGLASLEWIWRVAEMNQEKFWLPRLPNALGWVRRELLDMEEALRLDAEGARLGRDLQCQEGEANSHVNLGHDYIAVGELGRALEHLDEAERVYNSDVWNRWRYFIRLQGERAGYWIARGDLKQATHHADICREKARSTRSRKHWAWAHKLRGDIAMLEERAPNARAEYQTAISILDGFPCPFIEWKILLAASRAASALHEGSAADELRRRSRHVARALADSVREGALRERFLTAKAVRDI